MTPYKLPAGLNSFDMCLAVSGVYLQTQSYFKWSSKCSASASHRKLIARRLRSIWPGQPERHVSHETIYLAIYAYPRGELKRQLISYLRQADGKRRKRTQSNVRRERYPAQLSIHLRPPEVADRLVPGHWESRIRIMALKNCRGCHNGRTHRAVMVDSRQTRRPTARRRRKPL